MTTTKTFLIFGDADGDCDADTVRGIDGDDGYDDDDAGLSKRQRSLFGSNGDGRGCDRGLGGWWRFGPPKRRRRRPPVPASVYRPRLTSSKMSRQRRKSTTTRVVVVVAYVLPPPFSPSPRRRHPRPLPFAKTVADGAGRRRRRRRPTPFYRGDPSGRRQWPERRGRRNQRGTFESGAEGSENCAVFSW